MIVRLTRILRSAALACLVCASPASAEDAGPLRITVGIPYPQMDSLPIYAAQAQNFFSEQHIAVDLVSLDTGDKIAFALLGGSIQLGSYTPDWFIRAIDQGAAIKIVLGSASDLNFGMVASNDIKDFADLRGKRVGVSALKAADTFFVQKMLAAHGLGPHDYDIVPAGATPQRSAALIGGSLAATLLAPPEDQRLADQGGFHILDHSAKVISHYAWGGQAVLTDWAQAHHAALVGYIRGWIEGLRWVRDPANRDAAMAIASRNVKLDPRYARSLFESAFGPDTTILPDGKLDVIGYDAVLQGMVERGQITPPAPPAKKYLDTQYWEEAMQPAKRASR